MPIKKFIGDDCELSTTGLAATGQPLESGLVTDAILDCMGAAFIPHDLEVWAAEQRRQPTWPGDKRRAAGPQARWDNSGRYRGSYNQFDSNRCWLPNGGVAYCDCGKVEMCTAETLFPSTYARQHIGSLLIAEHARMAAEETAPVGTQLQLTAENVDPADPAISWGTHFNVSISKQLWEDLHFEVRHPNVFSFVVSALAAATAMFGSGYLLTLKNGEVLYSLSARAPHLAKLTSLSTVIAFQRGILNSRREGFSSDERQHLINFDFSPLSARLRCSVVQAIFAAAEEGYCGLNLFDPVKALRTWSFSLDMQSGRLREPALLADGRNMTLPQYMRVLCTALLEMVESGLIGPDVAPEAGELLPIVIELTHWLEAGELARSAKHLDWCVKLLFLLRMCVDGGAVLGDATTRLAGFDYTNTNAGRGWFWRLWEAGEIDPLVDFADVDAGLPAAPSESRAWARAALIQKFHEDIAAVAWDRVELSRGDAVSRWSPRLKIDLDEPDSFNQEEFDPIISAAESVGELEIMLRQRAAMTESDPVMEITTQLVLPGAPAGSMEDLNDN